MKRLLEFRIHDLMKDEETYNFLKKVKTENPDEYDRFVSLVGNKGLNIAKDKYKEFDPEHIKFLKKKKSKEKKEREKEERKKDFLKKYGGVISEIYDILDETPLKDLIYIIRKEKNLKKWKKIYKTLFKGIKTNIYKFEHRIKIAQVTLAPPNYKYMSEFGGSNINIKITQSVRLKNKKIIGTEFSIIFNYEEYYVDKFVDHRSIEILKLSSIKTLTIEEVKEKLEQFKYYMSDEYYKNWKMEQDINKFNL